ncbi:MAG: methyltransferase [Actinomycetota bacterium]
MTSVADPSVAAADMEQLFVAAQAPLAFHRRRLRFDLARTVFSSAGIDAGSMLLLRYLQDLPLAGGERVLDIGCGHGTLGLVLQALDDDRRIVSVDRDALALRYTRRNLALNELDPDAHLVGGSLGFDDVDRLQVDGGPAGGDDPEPFDLIVSNIPGKAGEPFIADVLAEATRRAHEGTVIGVVVVKPLGPFVAATIQRLGLEVLTAKGNKQYDVTIAIPPAGHAPAGHPEAAPPSGSAASNGASAGRPGGFERGVYDRLRRSFTSGTLAWTANTVTGLTEFDSLAHSTKMLRTALQGVPAGPSIVIEPGQGHRAVVAALAGYPPAVVLSRDLLALRATERMLQANGTDRPALVHDITVEAATAALSGPAPVVLLNAPDKVHGPWYVEQVKRTLAGFAAAGLDRPADLVLTGRAGLLGRLEVDVLKRQRGHVAHKRSERGFRVVRFRVPPAL